MRPLRAHRRLVSWMAVLAILMTSLAPALAHALSSSDVPFWSEVCSAQGPAGKQAAKDDLGKGAAGAHLLAHCPCCVGHAHAPGMPPPADLAVLLLDLKDELPAAFLAAPRTLHAWISAQPRAPPVAS